MVRYCQNIKVVPVVIDCNAQSGNPKYNQQLADSLGADDYGMKMYILVILKTGKTKIEDKQKSDSLLMGHLQNIHRLAEAGKLIVAGPMKENAKEYEGIFILECQDNRRSKYFIRNRPGH